MDLQKLDNEIGEDKKLMEAIFFKRVGAKYVRTYEKRAMTPYGRAMAHLNIADDVKEKLRKEHDTQNPLLLLKKIATLKKKIYELTKASQNRSATE